MRRITWGVIWIFENGRRKFCIKSSIEFFTIILSFLEKKYVAEFTFFGPILFLQKISNLIVYTLPAWQQYYYGIVYTC